MKEKGRYDQKINISQENTYKIFKILFKNSIFISFCKVHFDYQKINLN